MAGEVWVDVLRPFCPYLRAFLVKNAPGIPCKKIRYFLRSADISWIGANKAGLN